MKFQCSTSRSILVLCCFVILAGTFWVNAIVVAYQPPPSQEANGTTAEHDHDYYQRRLGIKHNYIPKFIDPELCGKISEEQCRTIDMRRMREDDNEDNEAATKQKQQKQRKLQVLSPVNGTLKILVVLVQWTNHVGNKTLIPKEDVEKLFNSDDLDEDLFPTGSVKRFFETMSYNAMSIEATVSDWIPTDNTEFFYSQMGDRGRDPGLQLAFDLPLRTLEATALPFSDFDQNGDGALDLTVFIHSGYDGRIGNVDCNTGATSEQRIAAHSLSSAQQSTWQSLVDGKVLGAYAVASAFRGACDADIARLGVLVHEMLHPFGLPDLYDRAGPFDPLSARLGGLGNYDIMSNPSGQRNSQARPGHLSAWSREQLGWLSPIEITQDGTYRLRPLELYPDAFKISRCDPGEYLLLENRQPIPGDFDEDMYDPAGILVYHIDTNVPFSFPEYNQARGFPGQDGWPQNGNHYAVALLQADGEYGLERTLDNGHSADFYNSITQELSPNGEPTFTSTGNYPNTDCYAGGQIRSSNVTIRNFQAVAGTDPLEYTFDVIGIQQVPPEPSQSPSMFPSTSPTSEEAISTSPTMVFSSAITILPSTRNVTAAPVPWPSAAPSEVLVLRPILTLQPLTNEEPGPVNPRPRPGPRPPTNGIFIPNPFPAPAVLAPTGPTPTFPGPTGPAPTPTQLRPEQSYFLDCSQGGKGKRKGRRDGRMKKGKGRRSNRGSCKKIRRSTKSRIKKSIIFETKGSRKDKSKHGTNFSRKHDRSGKREKKKI
jgi:M6 family metalloprotease-like protein